MLKNLLGRPATAPKTVALKLLPPRALNRYLAVHSAAESQVSRELKARCHALLADRLHIPTGSRAYKLYARQLNRNLHKWTIPPTHPYWQRQTMPHELLGAEHVQRCLAAGAGVIILTSHFGPWPFVKRELARHGIELNPTYPLGWPDTSDVGADARVRFLLRARKALARNGVVGLMGDVGVVGFPGFGRMLELPFLGGVALFPLGAAFLAVRTKAPLLPVFSVRHSDGRHTIVCTPPLDPADYTGNATERAALLLACYVRRLEQMIHAYPDNACSYLWLPPLSDARQAAPAHTLPIVDLHGRHC